MIDLENYDKALKQHVNPDKHFLYNRDQIENRSGRMTHLDCRDLFENRSGRISAVGSQSRIEEALVREPGPVTSSRKKTARDSGWSRVSNLFPHQSLYKYI